MALKKELRKSDSMEKQKYTKCYRCEKKAKLTKCKYCGNYFCDEHSDTKNHVCHAYKVWKDENEKTLLNKITNVFNVWDRKRKEERRKRFGVEPSIPYEVRLSHKIKIPTKSIIAIIILILIIGTYFYKPSLFSDAFLGVQNFISSLSAGTTKSSQLPQPVQPIIQNPIIARDYNIKVTNVETISDCSVFNSICSIVNIEIDSESSSSFSLYLNKYAIVLKDGTQYGIYSNILNSRCYDPELHIGQGFNVFPNGKQSFGLCFAVTKKEDLPKLYIGFLYNYKIEANGQFGLQITGEQRDYNFDLTPYLT